MGTLSYVKDFAAVAVVREKNARKRVTPLSTISINNNNDDDDDNIVNERNATIRQTTPPPFLPHIRFLLAIIRAIGLFPMKLPKWNEDAPQICYVAFTYSLCLYSIILYHIVIIYVQSVPRVLAPNQAFNVVVYIVGNLALIHTFTVIPFSHWLSAKKYATLVIRWTSFLVHYENIFGYYPNLKTKETVCRGIFSATFLIIIMGVAVTYGVRGKSYVLYEIFGLIMIFSSTAMLYTIFCKNVQIVADNLGTIFKRDSAPSLMTLHNALDMWVQLSAMMQTMNSMFDTNVVISLFITATSGSLAAFGLTIKLLKRHEVNETWFMSLIFQLSDVTNIYLLCNSSENATKHLGENIRRKILRCNFSKATFHELQQIDKFLQTMKINNPSLYVIGFVKINRKLFYKIYSILATYMIVLIQFQMTMPYQTV